MAPADNTVHLQRWREERAAAALARVDRVLDQAREHHKAVSFAQVAREAGVSRSWLYESPYATEIRSMRSQAPALPTPQAPSEASLRARLADALDDNRRLREELAAVRRQLERSLGTQRLGPTA